MRKAIGLLVAGILVGIIIALALSAPTLERDFPRPSLEPYVLAHEGGYSNDAHDPGGVTLNGIIQKEYNRYRVLKGRPQRPLTRAMLGTPDWIVERNDIYLNEYWRSLGIRGDDLPRGLDYVVFSAGVNSGIGWSGKTLRRVLGVPADEWKITDEMVRRIKAQDANRLINQFVDRREAFLRSLRTCQYFCKGWLARTASERANGHIMAGMPRGAFPLEHLSPAFGPGKAFEDDGDQP